ncbi:MAG: hypothetical protein KA314_04780 [Chloroflexi bacterium]|nr:hypothetical protein [Chloroflexota bacterium]
MEDDTGIHDIVLQDGMEDGRCYRCAKIRRVRLTSRGKLCAYCEKRVGERLGLKSRPQRK